MNRKEKVFKVLDDLNISYSITNHPPVPTVQEAAKYWAEFNGS